MKKMENELETLGFEQEAEFDRQFDKQLEKMINRKIRGIALKTAIAVVLAAVLIFLGISPLLNLYHTNPAELNKGHPSKLLSVMRAYYETMYSYREVCGIEVKKDGFGCYTLDMDLIDHSEGGITIGAYDVTMKMKRGKLSVENDSHKRTAYRIVFYNDADRELRMTKADAEDLVEDMKMLPRSSYLYLSVSDKKPRKIRELLEKNSDDFKMQWVQIYQPDCDFQAGMSLCLAAASKDTDCREELIDKQLKKVYIENLTLLRDNMEIWNGLEMPSNNSQYLADQDLLDQTIKNARASKKFETKNYCVSGTRDEVIAFLEAGNFNSINVDHVEYSTL